MNQFQNISPSGCQYLRISNWKVSDSNLDIQPVDILWFCVRHPLWFLYHCVDNISPPEIFHTSSSVPCIPAHTENPQPPSMSYKIPRLPSLATPRLSQSTKHLYLFLMLDMHDETLTLQSFIFLSWFWSNIFLKTLLQIFDVSSGHFKQNLGSLSMDLDWKIFRTK